MENIRKKDELYKNIIKNLIYKSYSQIIIMTSLIFLNI